MSARPTTEARLYTRPANVASSAATGLARSLAAGGACNARGANKKAARFTFMSRKVTPPGALDDEGSDGGAAGGSSGGQCSNGQILGGRWRVRRRVGKGTFSEIYEASDLQQERGADGRHPHVAVKVAREGQKQSMLRHEEDVIKSLQSCGAVARFVEVGRDSSTSCHYLVMQLLGENLSNMRRLTPTKALSLRTTAILGVQIIDAIAKMHELGFIHRDIKPSNCCVGLVDEKTIFLLDFGLVSAALKHADFLWLVLSILSLSALTILALACARHRPAVGSSRTASRARRAKRPNSAGRAATPPSIHTGTRSSAGATICGLSSTCCLSYTALPCLGRPHATTIRCSR